MSQPGQGSQRLGFHSDPPQQRKAAARIARYTRMAEHFYHRARGSGLWIVPSKGSIARTPEAHL